MEKGDDFSAFENIPSNMDLHEVLAVLLSTFCNAELASLHLEGNIPPSMNFFVTMENMKSSNRKNKNVVIISECRSRVDKDQIVQNMSTLPNFVQMSPTIGRFYLFEF